MILSIAEQIENQIKNSLSVLIALSERPSTNALVSALALQKILTSRNKQTDICSYGFEPPQKLSFIKNLDLVKKDVPPLHKIHVTIDKDKFPVSNIAYNSTAEKFRLTVTSSQNVLAEDAIEINKNAYGYDLIITINVVELNTLGKLFSEHQEFFFDTPIINIDHRPENERFGQINWVDINASSTATMIFQTYFDKSILDKQTAAGLLAGILDETHSLRSPQVSPHTLRIVSQLIQSGADYTQVTDSLYRTKTIGTLKLWGHILSTLQADRELSLAWSLIPESMFSVTGTKISQLHDLMNEVLNHSPEAKTVLLFIERVAPNNGAEIQISTKQPLNAKDLIKNWQPYGSERYSTAFIRGISLHDAEATVIPVVKKRLKNILG